MQVLIERSSERKEMRFSGTAQALCQALAINPETVLIIRNGRMVTEDEELDDADEITLLAVVSGG